MPSDAPSPTAPSILTKIPPAPPFRPLPDQHTEEFLAKSTNGEWQNISSVIPGGYSDDGQAALQRFLTDLLLSENLVVLTGLGTSLCILNHQGHRLAPMMSDLWNRANAILEHFK